MTLPALRSSVTACTLVAGLIFGALAANAASPPPVEGQGGAVASDERLATNVGLDILRAGGNAVDAAVATALAMAVVSPEAGNLGGGGFAVVRLPDSSENGAASGETLITLDFRETAPSAATDNMFLDAEGKPVDERSRVGGLAVGTPGTPHGLHALHERYGTLPWAAVVEPARRFAGQGFPISRRLAAALENKRELLSRFPETASMWLPDGQALAAGTIVRQPALAATLSAYAQRGPAAIVEGPIADAIEEVTRRYGGVLKASDLAGYQPAWRPPVRFTMFGWQVASMDLPSSGGIVLGSSFYMLERLPWAAQPRFGSGRAHYLAEVWKRAYADRLLLGDPEHAQADAMKLLAPPWIAERARTVSGGAARSSWISPWPTAGLDRSTQESDETTHISVIDAQGGAVALTTTLNGTFGSGLWVPEAGFFLNNEMDDFTAAPDSPNLYGLVQGEANAVRPGRRMLSSMTPTIAWRNGDLLAVGGRGGSRIPTAVHQVLLSLWVDGDGLQQAIDRPRLHHQWLPDALRYEPDALSPETRLSLQVRGHTLEPIAGVAQVHAVRLRDGRFESAADPRGGGGAAGVVEPLH
ncbi:MAG: gamma-glutamyltransferase [Acidobacteriota bacterium]